MVVRISGYFKMLHLLEVQVNFQFSLVEPLMISAFLCSLRNNLGIYL